MNAHFLFLGILFVLTSCRVVSQGQIELYPMNLPIQTPLETSMRISFGDHENDLDLDIGVIGLQNYDTNGNFMTASRSYILSGPSQNATYTPVGVHSANSKSACVWVDADNDGDLDLFLCGMNHISGGYAGFQRNDGNGQFTDVPVTAIPELDYALVEFADMDSDGDADMVIRGGQMLFGAPSFNRVLFNEGNFSFIDNGTLSAFDTPIDQILVFDINSDTYLDILYVDEEGGTPFINDGYGDFTQTGISGLDFLEGYCKPWDIDMDGKMDLVVTGNNWSGSWPNYYTKILYNAGSSFTPTTTTIKGYTEAGIACGDFDNDGDPDILLGGANCDYGCIYELKAYLNDGAAGFTENAFPVTPVVTGSPIFSVGDMDNDSDIDIAVAGHNAYNTGLTIYRYPLILRNDEPDSNAKPEMPANLSAFLNGDTVIFQWDAAVDDHTPGTGLTYNIRVGTTPGGSEIMSAESDFTTGFRRNSQFGNCHLSLSKEIKGLMPGTYYWSVQAIDNSFAGSMFAPEQTVQVTSTGTGINTIANAEEFPVYPNPVEDYIHMNTINSESIVELKVYNSFGQTVFDGGSLRNQPGISVSGFISGVYFIHVQSTSGYYVGRFVKK